MDMRSTSSFAVVAVLVLMLGTAGDAQAPAPEQPTPPAAARQMDHADLRRHIYVMEGALARAVAFGAQSLNREIRNAMPEMIALSGEPQARGVYLDGYGIYFDVAVPVLNQFVLFTMRNMMGADEGVVAALSKLKSYVENEKNPSVRTSLQAMIERLELQLGPLANRGSDQITPVDRPGSSLGVSAAMQPTDARSAAPDSKPAVPAAPTPRLDKKYWQDPNQINRAYTEAVQNALIETMLDWAVPTAIKPNEYLTVGARDNMQRDTLAPQDPYEEVVTILLRIKGSDIAAFRAGQIDKAEVRKRIQVGEF
jgi:hypothetical protein